MALAEGAPAPELELRHRQELTGGSPMNPVGSYRGDTADVWPELRRYVLSRGGMAAGAWSADLVPGGLYRRRGVAPDVLAAEMPAESECPGALGLWSPAEGSEAMLSALRLSYAAHVRLQAERGARRVESSRSLPRGQRRLSEHVGRLSERWGDRLDLSAIGEAGEEIVRMVGHRPDPRGADRRRDPGRPARRHRDPGWRRLAARAEEHLSRPRR